MAATVMRKCLASGKAIAAQRVGSKRTNRSEHREKK